MPTDATNPNVDTERRSGGLDEGELETRASDESLAPGVPLDRWGPFERLQRVGRGSFGEVYRAFDPTLQRHVALKLLLSRGLDREAEAGALLREARALARVRHSNVVPIYGVARHEGRVGFWSDFVKGRTLTDLLATQGPLGPREAALVGIDVCKAVAAVHAAGLLHGDIKAGNVMREEGGRILLMDFGLTHEYGTDHASNGTPAYMSPELLLGEPATISSDVYAIGVLLFFLLTAQHPVTGADLEQLRQAHASGTRRTLLDVRPDLPEPLANVIERAASPDPRKRFGSAGHMIAALSEAVGLERPVAERSHARVWRLLTWVAALAAVAAVGSAFLPHVWRMEKMPRIADARVAGVQEDYRRAADLLVHYYRPQAIDTLIPLLEEIVAKDAGFAPAYADLSRANFLLFLRYRDPKFLEPARQSALRAIAIAPDLASAHVTLGALYAQTGQNDLAAHELDEALRLDRFNAAAFAARADLYGRQGRTELVEPTLKKAISLAPHDPGVVSQLGEYYLDKGELARAGEQFRHVAELTPDNPSPHNNLGLVLRGLGRFDESAAAFRRAIDLAPSALRYRNLGMVLAEAGKYSDAAQMLRRAIDMRPTQYRAWGILASVYVNQHADETKVKATYLKAIELAAPLRNETPKDAFLLADLGQYYAFLRNERESLPLLAQAAALAPDTPEVLYEVAVGYEMLHHREDALQWLAKSRAGGYATEAIARNPQLAALRADPRYGLTVGLNR